MPGYSIDWPLIGDLLKASLPLAIAGAVAYVAWQQWLTAKNKLALDLFDRRFAVWRRIQEKIAERLKEIHAAHEKGEQPAFVSESLQSLWEALDDAHFLFGADVRASLQAVDDAIFSFGGDHPDEHVDYVTATGRQTKVSARHAGLEKITKARRALRVAVEPYMAMDAVGVNRPARPSKGRA